MRIIKTIIQFLNQLPNYDALTLPIEESLCNNIGFYGYIIDCLIKKRKSSRSKVATDMKLDPRVFGYIISRDDLKHRHIKFFELLRLVVVLNLSVNEGLQLINICNYSLCSAYLRDQIIFIILSTNHLDNDELDERLDCIIALEHNEPFNDNNFEYSTLFGYIQRKYEKM